MPEGPHVGAYDVLEPIGSGGMGEVYRARDTRLDRDVALKFLPADVRSNPDRLERFRREARALAALNHPNIAHIYGLEEVDGACCIAMELVRGETLEHTLRRGALPIPEALRIAKEMAEALEAAHAQGIVHRDLKPANVMLEAGGQIKVLDFGLAKAIRSSADEAHEVSYAATTVTRPGVILGTAAYMSPEQARGAPTDHRSDVFAFGCVLYEMLARTRAFGGETASDIMASVLARDPDLSRLPATLHPDVRRLIARCLEKSVRTRYQAMGDVRIEIERILTEHPRGIDDAPQSRSPGWRKVASFAVLAAAIGAVAALAWRQPTAGLTSPQRPVRRFSIPLNLVRPVPSPDGQHIAYRWQDRLWIRDLSSDTSREIPGGEAKGGYYNDTGYYLTWSPDSQSLIFVAENELRRISISGGLPATICTLPDSRTANKRVGGVAWTSDGRTVIFSRYGSGIYEVPARGGVPTRLWDEDHADDLVVLETAQGRTVLFAAGSPSGHDLVLRTAAGERRPIASLPSNWPELLYVPTGHILFRRNPPENSSLWALPYSPETGSALGEPFLVERSGQGASLSEDGTLVYLDLGRSKGQGLGWRDRTGKLLSKASDGHEVINVARLSPAGDRAVVTATDSGQAALWLYDVQRFVRTRFTLDSQSAGKQILFAFWPKRGNDIHYSIGSPAAGDVESFTKAADGTEPSKKILFPKGFVVAHDSSADGYIVVGYSPDGRNNQIWSWRAKEDGGGDAVNFSKNTETEQVMTLSPNGRYIAYTSTASGRLDIYVRPFPEGAGRWQISSNGGTSPRWGPDGRELFFVEGDTLMSVEVSTAGTFRASPTPVALFELPTLRGGPAPFARYDVAPDSRRFLTVEFERELLEPTVRVVENWLPEFRSRVSK